MEIERQGESELPEGFQIRYPLFRESSAPIFSRSLEAVKQPVPDSELKVTTSSVEIGSGETAQEADVFVSCCTEIDKTTENSVAPTPTTLGSINVETILSNQTKYSDLLARSCHEAHCQDLEGKHSNSESNIFYNREYTWFHGSSQASQNSNGG